MLCFTGILFKRIIPASENVWILEADIFLCFRQDDICYFSYCLGNILDMENGI